MLKKLALVLVFVCLACSGQPLYRDKYLLLGTYVEVISPDKNAGEIVYREVNRLDLIFNRYNPDSEIYKINNSFPGRINASEEIIEVLAKGKKYYHLSRGAFDISKGKLYDFWKEWANNKEKKAFPQFEEIKKARDAGSIFDLKITNAGRGSLVIKEKVDLDLSGIAKGYIVDKAVGKLQKAGIKQAVINAGGDLYCLGKPQGRIWQVGISGPFGDLVETIEIFDQAVASSGNYQQLRQIEGKNYSHIIDPRSGYPVESDLMGVTVVAGTAAEADALATIFFIKGEDFSREFVEKNPSIKVYFVWEDKIKTF